MITSRVRPNVAIWGVGILNADRDAEHRMGRFSAS
jgi:hypothetical protein